MTTLVDPPPLAENQSVSAMSVKAKANILVVDDEQNFVALLKWVLSKQGYGVHTALSGEEALALLDRWSFDLALLDLRIGVTDGIALLDNLRIRLPGLKVIMMTAFPTNVATQQAFERGASAFLTKPVDLDNLQKIIQTIL